MKKTGLILEGGGTRGVFSGGVLDCFMEQNLYLPYVIGVSAGACNAVNYIAKQPGRTKACMIDYLREGSYVGLKYFIKKHNMFDMDLIFDVLPNSEIPFDYETFFSSKQTCILTATNCLTGKAVYFTEKKSRKRLMAVCRASCSLPLISQMVYIDKIPLLDGGMSDSIPIKRAQKDGCEKNIVILTRNPGYRKPVTQKTNRASKIVYKHYPNLVRSIIKRPDTYNRTMEYLESQEKKGNVFLIQPQIPVIKNTEKNVDVLAAFYKHGYDYAKEIFPSVLKYLEKV